MLAVVLPRQTSVVSVVTDFLCTPKYTYFMHFNYLLLLFLNSEWNEDCAGSTIMFIYFYLLVYYVSYKNSRNIVQIFKCSLSLKGKVL